MEAGGPTDTEVTREVRLGLVFNGGVSLAVWMGGVTQEIDNARRGSKAGSPGTAALYHELLRTILHQSVIVDVIAGASAGGINGTLLATAIATGKELPDLRATWLTVGDLGRLMRPASSRSPPSLLEGNEVLYVEVLDKVRGLVGIGPPPPDLKHPVYLYVTATNLRGRPRLYRDSTNLEFSESDSRTIFSFESLPTSLRAMRGQEADAGSGSFTGDRAVEKLSFAARASSSFPAAFEAAGPDDAGNWFIDGGVLDNQPFGPVLDRIAILPGDGTPVKRVVGYIVPYVTETPPDATIPLTPATPAARVIAPVTKQPSAVETLSSASKLPRDLPKLESLDRVEADGAAQRSREAQLTAVQTRYLRAPPVEDLEKAAAALIETYKTTRRRAAGVTYNAWRDPDLPYGDGWTGRDPTRPPGAPRARLADDELAVLPTEYWIPVSHTWNPTDGEWRWGLSPAERVAAGALLFVRDWMAANPENPDLTPGRKLASELIWVIRGLTKQLAEKFRAAGDNGSLAMRVNDAYAALTAPDGRFPAGPPRAGLKWLQQGFSQLDSHLSKVQPGSRIIQSLLYLEVVRNAVRIDSDPPPYPFDFVFMSSSLPSSLGHEFTLPEQKLAGMKLGHFGGFLKSSWRANDWLWGRLDGVEQVLRATFDVRLVNTLPSAGPGEKALARKLAEFAFAPTARQAGLAQLTDVWILREQWARNIKSLRDADLPTGDPLAPLAAGLAGDLGNAEAADQFEEVLNYASDTNDPRALAICRSALAARIQLQVLAEELPVVAKAADDDVAGGTSGTAAGAIWAQSRRAKRVAATVAAGGADPPAGPPISAADLVYLFRDMKIGSESLEAELLSRPGVDLTAHALAVVVSAATGARGGLPSSLGPALTAVRAVTLALSYVTRTLARTPWAGAVVIAALSTVAYLGAHTTDTLLGTITPTVVMLSVASVAALLVTATGALEDARRGWQRILAATVAVVVAVASGGLLLGGVLHGPRRWVISEAFTWPTNVAGGLLLGAGVTAAVAGGLVFWKRTGSLKLARWCINGYRAWTVLAALVLAGGVLAHRYKCQAGTTGCSGLDWASIANQHAGILIGLSFLGAVLIAALFVEGAATIRTIARLVRGPDSRR